MTLKHVLPIYFEARRVVAISYFSKGSYYKSKSGLESKQQLHVADKVVELMYALWQRNTNLVITATTDAQAVNDD